MVALKWYSYLILLATALIPAAAAILIHHINKQWKWFQRRNYWIQQLLIGIVFSWFALSAFYFGVDYSSVDANGIYKNVIGNFSSTNGIPLVAGLVFGGPSGFFAGTIAAIYRLVIYPFGSGDYLRAAECITVFLSGGVAWLLRVWLFDNKKPKWYYGLIIGIFIECIHMLLIFTVCIIQVDSVYAYGIIRVCDVHCFLTVGLAITLALMGIALLEKEKLFNKVKGGDKRIATKIQKWLSLTFAIGIVVTFTFTFFGNYQKGNYEMEMSLTDSNNDIVNLVNSNKRIYSPKNFPQKDWGSQQYLDFVKYNQESGAYYLTCSHRIGREGYAIVLDYETQRMLSLPTDFSVSGYSSDVYIGRKYTLDGTENGKTLKGNYEENKIYELKIPQDYGSKDLYRCYVRITHVSVPNRIPTPEVFPKTEDEMKAPDFMIASFISKTEVIVDTGITFRLTAYLELLIFIIIFEVIYIFIKKVVVVNVHKINASLDRITDGNLNVKVNVRSNKEFSDLSDDINQTVDTLKHFIEEANKRIDNELKYAKEIQQSSLPIIFPNTSQYELYATMHPAKQVGGDFYDFFPIDTDHIFILMADVSGKGIPAAMYMMRAKTLVKSLVTTNELSLDQIITGVNDELNRDNKTGMFVTAWFGILNIKTGDLEFVNAGHCPPLVGKPHKYEYLKMVKNTVLGVIPGINYKLERIKLKPSESIILYTDGVTEATSKKKKLFGESKLQTVVNSSMAKNTNEMLNTIYTEVDKFQRGVEQADDITMLMVKYKPKK